MTQDIINYALTKLLTDTITTTTRQHHSAAKKDNMWYKKCFRGIYCHGDIIVIIYYVAVHKIDLFIKFQNVPQNLHRTRLLG